jgi:hypothetical protein
MSEKIVGYLLLLTGLVMISFSALNVYQVFTKRQDPINLFTLSSVSLDIGSYLPTGATGSSKPPPAELFSSTDLNFISNLTAHYLLMSFFISLGAKVSSLGINLLRPIEVRVDSKRIADIITSATKPTSASAPVPSAKP